MGFNRTASGLSRYDIEVSHHEVRKYQLVRGDSQEVVAKGATAQMTEWDGIWARRSEADQVRGNVEWANEASTQLTPVRSDHEVDTASCNNTEISEVTRE